MLLQMAHSRGRQKEQIKSEMNGENMLKDRKKSIGIMVLLAGILFAGIIVYAAYVSQGHQKAVVATAKKSTPFSSNYLRVMDYSETPTLETVSPALVTDENDTVTFDVTVNNFSLTNASQSADGYITYTVTFEFDGETTDCTVNDEKPANGKVTVTDTLKLGRNTNHYRIKIPDSAIGTLKIHAKVIPDDASRDVVGNKILAATLVPQRTAGKIDFNYDGTFVDGESGKKPYEYSAFRYRVEITTGIADVTLSWNSDYIELDPVFIESLGLKSGDVKQEGNKKSISFVMDYSDVSSYNMIFYRKKGRDSKETWQSSWENLKSANLVTVSATERTTDSVQR